MEEHGEWCDHVGTKNVPKMQRPHENVVGKRRNASKMQRTHENDVEKRRNAFKVRRPYENDVEKRQNASKMRKRSLVRHLVLGAGPVHRPLETGLELVLILFALRDFRHLRIRKNVYCAWEQHLGRHARDHTLNWVWPRCSRHQRNHFAMVSHVATGLAPRGAGFKPSVRTALAPSA